MKQLALLTFLFLNLTVFGQRRKLPAKGHYHLISKTECAFPRQTGKLEIIRTDSVTYYRTDSSEMSYEEHDPTGWNNEDEMRHNIFKRDSLISLLFQNGLLTSDLLIQAYNVESIYINHHGDTLDRTQHVEVKTIEIVQIGREELPEKGKDQQGVILFEIWANFGFPPDCLPTFALYLKADIELTAANLTEYLKGRK